VRERERERTGAWKVIAGVVVTVKRQFKDVFKTSTGSVSFKKIAHMQSRYSREGEQVANRSSDRFRCEEGPESEPEPFISECLAVSRLERGLDVENKMAVMSVDRAISSCVAYFRSLWAFLKGEEGRGKKGEDVTGILNQVEIKC
jgi:hypothetical protein